MGLSALCATAVNVECKYSSNYDWTIVGKIYYCEVQSDPEITSIALAKITSVSGAHEQGKNNDKVEGFEIAGKTVNYFPHGIEKFFKNLKLVRIASSHLKQISQADLKVFPKLENVDFYDNDIEVLDNELFKFNPKLKIIFVYNNKISKIHSNTFDNLNYLSNLYVSFNKCTGGIYDVADSISEVQEVIQQLKTQCSGN